MKKLLALFSISIFLFSCQKSNQVSIVGTWREVSVYEEISAGQSEWGPASRFPLKLSLSANGEYSAFNDVPAGEGNYTFDYSTRKLQLQIVNPISTEVYNVSYIDESYLVIDYSTNYKVKFVRL